MGVVGGLLYTSKIYYLNSERTKCAGVVPNVLRKTTSKQYLHIINRKTTSKQYLYIDLRFLRQVIKKHTSKNYLTRQKMYFILAKRLKVCYNTRVGQGQDQQKNYLPESHDISSSVYGNMFYSYFQILLQKTTCITIENILLICT